MRKTFRGSIRTLGLATLGVLAFASVGSSAQAQRFPSLLGVRIWESKWNNVLKLYGQPTRIEVGAVTTGTGGGASMAGGGLSMGSGLPGMPGMGMRGGGMMAGGGMLPPPGIPGGGGSSAMGNPANMMSMTRGAGAAMGRGMGMGRGGLDMGDEGGGGGIPGFNMGSMPGSGMGAGGGEQQSQEDEVTWIYDRKGKNPLTYMFLFNRDGRLIQAQAYGYNGVSATLRNQAVRLGDSVSAVYRIFGFTGNVTKDDQRSTMTLDYSKEHNIAFQLADLHKGQGYRVVGITVGLTDKSQIPGNLRPEEEK